MDSCFIESIPTYQRSLLHALHHHEEDLLCLAPAVVEGLLDCDHQLIFGAVAQQSGEGEPGSSDREKWESPQRVFN